MWPYPEQLDVPHTPNVVPAGAVSGALERDGVPEGARRVDSAARVRAHGAGAARQVAVREAAAPVQPPPVPRS